jgi:acyl carrier protein phosphodiesterase
MALTLKMNYLAHALLSFDKPGILTGNMISDFVKGKAKFTYPIEVQQGIHLHRLIDNFTDLHPATAEAKKFFHSQYRLYSGPFVDIIYDHFLALDQNEFIEYNGLENFSKTIYQSLQKNAFYFPEKFSYMFPYMKAQNWLYSYRLREGMQKSFTGLVHRATYLNESDIAFKIFNEHYDELKSCYIEFFPALKRYALESLDNLVAG